MTINIQKCSNVTVVGHHNHKNCKPVYCITTGEMFASALDAAKANGVEPSPMSSALTGKTKRCNGKRFCYVSNMMEHLEEINEANRARIAKATAYDAEVERRNLIAKAQADVQKREEKVAELRRQLDEAEAELIAAKYDLIELQSGN